MSIIAIGATAAVGATVTAGTVAAGVTLAGTAYSAYSASKNSKAQAAAAQQQGAVAIDPRRLNAILKELEEFDPMAVAAQAADFNFKQGVPMAQKSATKLNTTATSDTIAAMNRMFGSLEAYEEIRDKSLADIGDHLDGRISASTRRGLGRRLLASGVSELGDGATDDAMTGYLGMTAEDLGSRGQREFSSLYSTWRQAVPLVNGASILSNFTMDPGQMAGLGLQQATSLAGLELQGLGAQYQSDYNQAGALADAARARANGDAQVAGQIASGLGAMAGTFTAPTATTTATAPNNYGGNGIKTNYGGFGGTTQVVNGRPVQSYRPQTVIS